MMEPVTPGEQLASDVENYMATTVLQETVDAYLENFDDWFESLPDEDKEDCDAFWDRLTLDEQLEIIAFNSPKDSP